MKPKNFPGRKQLRRESALRRIERKYEIFEEAPEKIVTIYVNTENKLNPSATRIRTKKNRTAQGKRRKE